MNDLDELLKAFELVEEYDRQRPVVLKEYRLYYHDDGTVIGLWESDFPEGDNYIVLENPDDFHKHSTPALRVRDGKLTVIDLRIPLTSRLEKADDGQPVVKGMAALALNEYEQFKDVEYYGRKSDN
jgi:hypothetical protein